MSVLCPPLPGHPTGLAPASQEDSSSLLGYTGTGPASDGEG